MISFSGMAFRPIRRLCRLALLRVGVINKMTTNKYGLPAGPAP
jgi:hypothetical protein